jgi:hypothetical protein
MKGYETSQDFKWIYSQKVDKQIKDALLYSEEKGRVKVGEWRNFVDYDIIPLIRLLIEENIKPSNNNDFKKVKIKKQQ